MAEGDAPRIATFLSISEEKLRDDFLEEIELFNKKVLRPALLRKENAPYGKCIFYDEAKGCTIHPVKPLQCKTSMGCKEYGQDLTTWFYVNHVVDPTDTESLQQWKAYLAANRPIKGSSAEELTRDHQNQKVKQKEDFPDSHVNSGTK